MDMAIWQDVARTSKQAENREGKGNTRAQKRRWRKRWKKKNPERAKEHKERQRRAHPEKNRRKSLDYLQKNRIEVAVRQCARKFKISREEARALLQGRKGPCEICGQGERVKRRGRTIELSTDHDHKTGRPRGTLCNFCNTALGMFQDDPARMRRAADYVEKYLAKHSAEPLVTSQ